MTAKKAAKKSTSEKKILTPKQAQIKVGSLFKGLDNEVTKIQTGMKAISTIKSQISSLALGLANVAVTATTAAKAAVKTPAKTPAKATAKPAKAAAKATAKPAKAVVKSKPAKTTTKSVKEPKVAKSTSVEKAPVPNRPTTRESIKEVLTEAGEFLPIINVRDRMVAKYGYISRQSVYQAAKKDESVIIIDGKLGLAGFTKPVETAETADADADADTDSNTDAEEALVNKIAQSQATSAMA